MQTDAAQSLVAAPADDDLEPIWNPTPSPDQVRGIVRLFQCRQCNLLYTNAVTLPCGRSICKTCLPETYSRTTAITYPANPDRVPAFKCPFQDCDREHVLNDCSIDVVLNKAAQIMASEIAEREVEATCKGIATNIHITQTRPTARETASSDNDMHQVRGDGQLLLGDRLVVTWSLASKGGLDYEADIEYSEGGAPAASDEATAFNTLTLSKVQEAMRSEVDCQICYAILYDPLTTGCGHTFCRACLHRILDHSQLCPACRRRLFMSPLFHRNLCPSNSTILNMTQIFWKNEVLHREQSNAAQRQRELDSAHMPLFVCTLSFPTMPTILHVFEPRYRLMIRRVLDGNKTFGMVLPKPHPRPGEMPFFPIGTLLRIENTERYRDGRYLIETVGVHRFRVTRHGELDGYAVGEVERIPDAPLEEEEAQEAAEVRSDEDGRGMSPAREGGAHGETSGTTNGMNGTGTSNGEPGINGTTQSNIQGEQHSDTEMPSGHSQLSQDTEDWVPRTTAELNWMTTQELFRFVHDFVSRTQDRSLPWLTDQMLRIYGPPPQDPANFPWWLASILPIINEEKYRLLGTSNVRERLKICGAWILATQKVPWSINDCVIL